MNVRYKLVIVRSYDFYTWLLLVFSYIRGALNFQDGGREELNGLPQKISRKKNFCLKI